MARFRKKPVEIEAMQLTASNVNEVARWCGGGAIEEVSPRDHTDVYVALDIPTLEGVMRANCGDWVIRGVQGEFYPCKPDIFAATYDDPEALIDTRETEPQQPEFVASAGEIAALQWRFGPGIAKYFTTKLETR